MDKKNILVWGGIVLILGGIAAAVYFYIKKQRDAEAERLAKAEQEAAAAAALAAANEALINEQTDTLNALFPDEPNILGVGTGANGLQNANAATAIDANSTGGGQLIRQTASLIGSNAATWRTAVNRAGGFQRVFAGVPLIKQQKIKEALQTRLGWSGQENDFPVFNRYTQLDKYNNLMGTEALAKTRADFIKSNPNAQRNGYLQPTDKQTFSLNNIGYSIISDSGMKFAQDPSETFNGNGLTPDGALAGFQFLVNWAYVTKETDIALTAIATQMLIDQGRIFYPE
jgi:hypothetical protein